MIVAYVASQWLRLKRDDKIYNRPSMSMRLSEAARHSASSVLTTAVLQSLSVKGAKCDPLKSPYQRICGSGLCP